MIIDELILAAIGWLFLFARHRDREVVKRICEKEYAGSYSAVGLVLILKLVAGLGAALLTLGLLAIIVASIFRAVNS